MINSVNLGVQKFIKVLKIGTDSPSLNSRTDCLKMEIGRFVTGILRLWDILSMVRYLGENIQGVTTVLYISANVHVRVFTSAKI
jgi:hypothetical protein